MKKKYSLLCLLVFGLCLQSCSTTKVQAQTNPEAGIESAAPAQPRTAELFTDIEAAKKYAAAQDVDILMVFGGSDWCKPCIRFKKDILEAESFKKWSTENMAVLYLDFPAKKQNKLSGTQTAHNEALAEKFNKSGFFPNLFVIDAEEKVLANPKFKNQDADTFIGELQNVK